MNFHILFNFNQITDNDAFSLFIAGENSLDLRVFSVYNSFGRKIGRVNFLTNFKSDLRGAKQRFWYVMIKQIYVISTDQLKMC